MKKHKQIDCLPSPLLYRFEYPDRVEMILGHDLVASLPHSVCRPLSASLSNRGIPLCRLIDMLKSGYYNEEA